MLIWSAVHTEVCVQSWLLYCATHIMYSALQTMVICDGSLYIVDCIHVYYYNNYSVELGTV